VPGLPPPVTAGGTEKGAIGLKFKVRPGGGLVVEQVKPGGPCDKAGLRPGDVIEEVNGERIQRDHDKHEKPLEFYNLITGKNFSKGSRVLQNRITGFTMIFFFFAVMHYL
jgi:C-terminal processing protease CtpA/Prc